MRGTSLQLILLICMRDLNYEVFVFYKFAAMFAVFYCDVFISYAPLIDPWMLTDDLALKV